MLKVTYKKNVLPNFLEDGSDDPVVVSKVLSDDTISPEMIATFETSDTVEEEEPVFDLNIQNPLVNIGDLDAPIPILVEASITTKAEMALFIDTIQSLHDHMEEDAEPA